MRKLLFIISITLFVQGLSAQKFQDTIPFRNDLGLIIIPISFNGEEKQFVFDTGADVTVAYGWAKESLKRTNRTLNIRSSSNLSSRMRYYKSGVISLGSRKVRGHQILNASKNDIFSCYQIDGILGTDIIKLLNWKIDFKNKLLIMYPSKFIPKEVENMYRLDFSFSGKRPYVYMKRQKSRFQFLLDTGASGYSNISTRQYRLTELEKFDKKIVYTGTFDVNGIFSKGKTTIFTLPTYTSGKVNLSPIIKYNSQKSTKIGNKLWKGKSLFLSLPSKKLWVSSDSITEKGKTYSGSVMSQKGVLRIMSVVKGSALWESGIRQGDEISLFNGKKYSSFCELDKEQRALFKKGKSIKVTLLTGKEVELTLLPLEKPKK